MRSSKETVATKLGRTVAAAALLAAAMWSVPAKASTRSQQLYAKGLVPFHAERWEEAYLVFDDATIADPDDALAVYYRGLTGARLGFVQEAIKNMEHALQLQPDLPHGSLDLGILYFDEGQYATAEEWLQRAYQQPRNHFAAALFLGLSHFRRGDNEAARTYLAEAAKDPELRVSAKYYDALVLLRLDQTEEARGALAEVQAEAPTLEAGQAAQEYLAGPTRQLRPPRPKGAQEPPWSVYGDLGFGYDSNVRLAPKSDAIRSSLGIGNEDDGFTRMGVGGRYRLFDSDVGVGVLSYDFYQSVHFDISRFDLQGHTVRLDFTTPPEGLLQLGITGLYDLYLLDNKSFFQDGLASPWVTVYEGQVAATQVYYRFRSRDYQRRPFGVHADAYNNAGGVNQYFLLGAVDRVLTIGYQIEDNDPLSASGTDFAWLANQIDLDLEFAVLDWGDAVVAYVLRLEDYEHPNSRSGFRLRRHDTEHQLLVSFERPLTSYLTASVNYIGIINDSNLPEFEYDRMIVWAGVRLHF